jgi:hypothetical protein
MNVVTLKSIVVKKVNKLSDQTVLEELSELIDEMKKSEGADFWDELTSNQKKSVEISRKQIKEGETIPHEGLKREVKGWLKK